MVRAISRTAAAADIAAVLGIRLPAARRRTARVMSEAEGRPVGGPAIRSACWSRFLIISSVIRLFFHKLCEVLFESFSCPVEPDLQGVFGYAQDCGDFGGRKLVQIP